MHNLQIKFPAHGTGYEIKVDQIPHHFSAPNSPRRGSDGAYIDRRINCWQTTGLKNSFLHEACVLYSTDLLSDLSALVNKCQHYFAKGIHS